jgi:hypothetical protein
MSHVVAPILPDRQGQVKGRGQEPEGVASPRKKVAARFGRKCSPCEFSRQPGAAAAGRHHGA